MNRTKWAAVAVAALLLTGCSREGFKASLSRSSPSSPSSLPASSSAEEPAVFEIGIGEVDSGGILMSYALPRGSGSLEKTASLISEKIHAALFQVSDRFDLTAEGARLQVYDGVTKNDGTYYSVLYDCEYTPAEGKDEQMSRFGMTFDSLTGERIALSKFFDPAALSVLLTDEQSSTIMGKDEQLVAAQRSHLSTLGAEALCGRMEAADGTPDSVESMFDVSFYLEGNQLVAVLAASQELGGSIEVAVVR